MKTPAEKRALPAERRRCRHVGRLRERTGPPGQSKEVTALILERGFKGLSFGSKLVASKHGVVGLTKALAVDWGRYDIRVNALCPGMTWTDLSKQDQERNPGMFVERERRIPLGHAAQPREQAEAILFLASAAASAVNGLIMNVDGGNLAMSSGSSLPWAQALATSPARPTNDGW
ncbi:SDR family oxidoreductase [Variovorax guangxiensis]|uniref:SDR family oxidoreductase n=1 Tax=Variovorax guangxiensis TaxID=1775474 RepID=UPI00285BB582|nr:SDR family oxidoreductase [Variovorax guangxiensis]MDR6855665.1 NAD(P)-dependent dehydrogenase (short-subunit alcohol dehydrogenase family) [Variovorax guangxiensis]